MIIYTLYNFLLHIQGVSRLGNDSTYKNVSKRKNKIFSLKPSFSRKLSLKIYGIYLDLAIIVLDATGNNS